MSYLDVIVGPSPVERSFNLDWEWINWFFSSLEEADFVIMLCIFGAVYLMLLSVITIFTVMFLKQRNITIMKPAADADGSVHVIPFLLSIFGTFMVAGGIAYILYVLLVIHPYYYRHLPYILVVPYAVVTAAMHILALRFSPKASRFYKNWNIACLVPCILVLIVALFFCLFYWFTMLYWSTMTVY